MMISQAKEPTWVTMICRAKLLIWAEMKANKNKERDLEKMMICKVMEVI